MPSPAETRKQTSHYQGATKRFHCQPEHHKNKNMLSLGNSKTVQSEPTHLHSYCKFPYLPQADQVPLIDELQQPDPGWIHYTC